MKMQNYDDGMVTQTNPVITRRIIVDKPPEPVALLTREQLEKLVEDTVDQVLEKRLKEVEKQVDRIKLDKEILRQALVKEGYAIPEGLNMAQWVPYIEGRDRR